MIIRVLNIKYLDIESAFNKIMRFKASHFAVALFLFGLILPAKDALAQTVPQGAITGNTQFTFSNQADINTNVAGTAGGKPAGVIQIGTNGLARISAFPLPTVLNINGYVDFIGDGGVIDFNEVNILGTGTGGN
ncbi:MAG: hypothetical protein AAF403_01020, partial [Pseudomonadota bacterium]